MKTDQPGKHTLKFCFTQQLPRNHSFTQAIYRVSVVQNLVVSAHSLFESIGAFDIIKAFSASYILIDIFANIQTLIFTLVTWHFFLAWVLLG